MKNILPIIDLRPHLFGASPREQQRQEKKLRNALKRYSAVLVRDPRVSQKDNARYLDLLERYFAQSPKALKEDERPDLDFQRGVSPPFSERPNVHHIRAFAERMPARHRPHVPPEGWRGDARYRFFRGLGRRPEQTEFATLNSDEVIPKAFQEEWCSAMDSWGTNS